MSVVWAGFVCVSRGLPGLVYHLHAYFSQNEINIAERHFVLTAFSSHWATHKQSHHHSSSSWSWSVCHIVFRAAQVTSMMISNEVLRTALSTLQALPAMSLSGNNKLDSLGAESLQQVCHPLVFCCHIVCFVVHVVDNIIIVKWRHGLGMLHGDQPWFFVSFSSKYVDQVSFSNTGIFLIYWYD